MRVTIKGQVTIPQHIREKFGITPAAEVDFIEEKEEKDHHPKISKPERNSKRQDVNR